MRKQSGFTVLELVVAIIILLAAGTIFWIQKNDLAAGHRDNNRKTAINAIYYNLEELVYPALGGYPAKLDAKQLRAMDAELLKDSKGKVINETGSEYRYEPSGCNGNICQHYIVRADLEKEGEFVKNSQR